MNTETKVEKVEKTEKMDKVKKVGTIISACLEKGVKETAKILAEVQKVHPTADLARVRRQIYSRRWAFQTKKSAKSKK